MVINVDGWGYGEARVFLVFFCSINTYKPNFGLLVAGYVPYIESTTSPNGFALVPPGTGGSGDPGTSVIMWYRSKTHRRLNWGLGW